MVDGEVKLWFDLGAALYQGRLKTMVSVLTSLEEKRQVTLFEILPLSLLRKWLLIHHWVLD